MKRLQRTWLKWQLLKDEAKGEWLRSPLTRSR